MGDITLKQTLTISAYKTPTITGAPINEKDFELSPAEQLEITDMNEDSGGRFNLPSATTDKSIGMGTVALGKVLVIKPESEMKIKIVNAAGTSQLLTIKAGRTTVFHGEFINVLLTNDGANAVKGKFFVAGD